MEFPTDLKYSKEHTWLQLTGPNEGIIGITEFAQSELGEIVYVDLPETGTHFKKNEVFGSIEAVKTTSDLFMPVGGEIIEINKAVVTKPDLVNTAPFREGWMIRIKMDDLSEIEKLLDTPAYATLVNI